MMPTSVFALSTLDILFSLSIRSNFKAHSDCFPPSVGLRCLPNASFLEKVFPHALHLYSFSPLSSSQLFVSLSCLTYAILNVALGHAFLRMQIRTQLLDRHMAVLPYGPCSGISSYMAG